MNLPVDRKVIYVSKNERDLLNKWLQNFVRNAEWPCSFMLVKAFYHFSYFFRINWSEKESAGFERSRHWRKFFLVGGILLFMLSAMFVKYLLNSVASFNGSDSGLLPLLRVMLPLFDFDCRSDTNSLIPFHRFFGFEMFSWKNCL